MPRPFEAPQAASPVALEVLRAAAPKRTLSEDVGSGEVCVTIEDDLGAVRFTEHGLAVDQRRAEQYRTLPQWDPLSTQADIHWQYRVERERRGRWRSTVACAPTPSGSIERSSRPWKTGCRCITAPGATGCAGRVVSGQMAGCLLILISHGSLACRAEMSTFHRSIVCRRLKRPPVI